MEEKDETKLRRDLAAHARHLHEEIEQLREERNRLLEIEDRYNSIKQMHDDLCVERGATPTFRGDTCWFCEEERLDRED